MKQSKFRKKGIIEAKKNKTSVGHIHVKRNFLMWNNDSVKSTSVPTTHFETGDNNNPIGRKKQNYNSKNPFDEPNLLDLYSGRYSADEYRQLQKQNKWKKDYKQSVRR